ncbi:MULTISPECIES: peptide deformylase [Hydrocarboniphaga]|jgi:peptide deformylase|uniref:Peptide deformylase n=1 Tax=Hydrocarboniphaga effusa AP103 TaxID=1172194 RepID=I8TD89_9GAMM|nr:MULTISPECIES: peptide deformylase [Hydrocarboniphaga]EIT71673.1 peptide deformylase [Hydrocarboniphaga effusa AP103]MDZ4080297.1 peptide deformylase [Hydrocarboniphaga sp.]
MAVLEILHHPDPRLRIKARPVVDFGPSLQKLIDDMFETMYAAPGVGLAATQVGIDQRIAVMDAGAEGKPDPQVLINPVIVEASDKQEMEEGCLSVPDVADKVQRYNKLKLKAFDRNGSPYEVEVEGLRAQAIQHEIDHLDGKLYIDYLSSLKRERILKKLRKQAARAA